MKAQIHPSLVLLQSAMEERADAMSSAAQILLHGMANDGAAPPWQRDVERIHQSARGIYRLVHEQLVAQNFPDPERSYVEELHGLRHELRGLLQNILGRCQLVLEEEDVEAQVRQELVAITSHATACVHTLNLNSHGAQPDSADESAVTTRTAHLEEDEIADVSGHQIEPGRILVADDSASSREVLGRFLEAQGHEVMFAATGKQALERVKESDFDLILLDLVMPELNGFEVLKAMRRERKLRHTFVIIISGLDAATNAIRGIELGAVDFLSRPIDLRLLRARVNACLERQRLRERELAQYFTPELARHLLRHPEKLEEGRRVEVTALFCDVVGFSRVSEQCGPELTIRWLGDVLETLSACIMAQEGVLVDFTGDQVMGLWGAPHDQGDQADRACRAGLAMLNAMPQVNERWKEVVGLPTQVSIGINTGEAYVGNIGTPQKFKYGALGNTVNLASRVQGACKYVRSRLLATGNTIARLNRPLNSRRLGQVRVTNIAAPVHIHELVPPQQDTAWQNLKQAYETALNSFEAGEFSKASSVLGGLLDTYPNDGPSLLLMSRVVEQLLRHEPDKFDPVWEMPGK
jgi:class 3 adenylate cyclase